MNDEDLIRSVLQQVDADASKKVGDASKAKPANVANEDKSQSPFEKYCTAAIS